MPETKFLQVHILQSHIGTLLNRDDNNAGKSITIGGFPRSRQSSQSIKYHIAHYDGEYALTQFGDLGTRSKDHVPLVIIGPLRQEEAAPEEVLEAVEKIFLINLHGPGAERRENRQSLLMGHKVSGYFAGIAREIVEANPDDPGAAEEATKQFFKQHQANQRVIYALGRMPQGVRAALFGNMVTSDYAANIDAATMVAHSFTTHAEQVESDYLTAVDDLSARGAGHVTKTEVNSGVYYSYMAVDIPQLVANVETVDRKDWKNAERAITGAIAESLMHIIVQRTNGAKMGSTAAASYPCLILLELGSRNIRSLAQAFEVPTEPHARSAIEAMADHLVRFDQCYGPHEARRVMSTYDQSLKDVPVMTHPELATWVGQCVGQGFAD